MSSHTPTPWIEERGLIMGAGEPAQLVATTVAMRPVDIEFLLRAVNAHELMLSALEAVRNTDDHADPEVRAIVRAAIAKARGTL